MNTVDQVTGGAIGGENNGGVTSGDLGSTVDQTVADVNNTVDNVTDSGQTPVGVDNVATAAVDSNLSTNLADPSQGPIVDANVCANVGVLDTVSGTNCDNAPSSVSNGAIVNANTNVSTTDPLGKGSGVNQDLCLNVNALNDASNSCGASSSASSTTGLADVGLTRQARHRSARSKIKLQPSA